VSRDEEEGKTMSTRILVVDDDADIAMVLSDRLQAMGYEVQMATEGQAALTLLEEDSPALLLLDLEMPKMSGMDVLKRVRKEWPDLPVIVMTAHGTIARAVEAMKEGASDFITKPFDPDHLKSVLAKALEMKNLGREVGRLLGDINHEIKNLMTPVVCGAWILESEMDKFFEKLPEMEATKAEASHKVCAEVIEMLRDTARRIQDRTKEIADYVKGLSVPPQFVPCRVATVVESVLKTLHLLAEERGIALRQEGLDTLPSILADDRHLYKAFYNLVNNAIAEVPAGGSITIRGDAESERDTILLSVADTGRGMPEEVRKSLFTTRTISRKPGGTGLGTRIVKDVVEAHGGRITGESQEGVGTTFFIRLPLQPQVGAGSPKVMQ
jgi:signal transduction histidine kinase